MFFVMASIAFLNPIEKEWKNATTALMNISKQKRSSGKSTFLFIYPIL